MCSWSDQIPDGSRVCGEACTLQQVIVLFAAPNTAPSPSLFEYSKELKLWSEVNNRRVWLHLTALDYAWPPACFVGLVTRTREFFGGAYLNSFSTHFLHTWLISGCTVKNSLTPASDRRYEMYRVSVNRQLRRQSRDMRSHCPRISQSFTHTSAIPSFLATPNLCTTVYSWGINGCVIVF